MSANTLVAFIRDEILRRADTVDLMTMRRY